MPTTIYGFFKDNAFKDMDAVARQENPGGAVGLPSLQSLSYFADAGELADTRAARPWIDAFTATTRPTLLVDIAQYPSLISTDFADIDQADRDKLFNMLDRIAVHIVAGDDLATIETEFTTVADYDIYTAETLAWSTNARVEGTLYNAASTLVAVPEWVSFSVQVNGTSGTQNLDFKIWLVDDAFKAEYPITTITAVIANLSYNDILTAPLTGGGSNILDVANVTADLIANEQKPLMNAAHQTALYQQDIKLYDAMDNARPFPFGILHKGLTPDLLSMRTEIRTEALASGFGDETAWRARAPELFIVDQFYIIPMWDLTTSLLDGSVNPSIVSVANMLAKTKTALPTLSDIYVDANLEAMSVVYNAMQVAAVPHPDNLNYTSIYEVHPTYQNYAASEPGFLTMEADTKTFSNRLNTAMAVAAGVTVNEAYAPRLDGGNTYIPFVVGTTEYYVITIGSYENRVG